MNLRLRLLIRLAVCLYFCGFAILTLWGGNFVTNLCLYKFSLSEDISLQAGFALAGITLSLSAFFFLFMKSWVLKLLALVPLLQGLFCLWPINGQNIDISAACVHFFIAVWFYVLGRFVGNAYNYQRQTLGFIQYSMAFLFIAVSFLNFFINQHDITYLQEYLQMVLDVASFHKSVTVYLIYLLGFLNLMSGIMVLYRPRVLLIAYMVFFGGLLATSKIITGVFHGYPDTLLRSIYFLIPIIYYSLASSNIEKKFFKNTKGHL